MPGFWRLFSQGTAGLHIAASTNHGTHSLHKLSPRQEPRHMPALRDGGGQIRGGKNAMLAIRQQA